MNIFIDEAGVFVIPSKKKCSISCVGGLAIPEKAAEKLFFDFLKLKESWGVGADEIKGSRLSESQVQSVIRLLRQCDVIFDIVAIDMNKQQDKAIIKHKSLQGDNFTKNLTSQHQATLVEDIYKLRADLLALNSQLYVQAVCTLELLTDIFQTITLYYVQRLPDELGAFHWYVDAKDNAMTPYEKLWKSIILPMQQARSFSKPLIQLEGADYSHFEKFCEITETAPEHIREHVKTPSPFEFVKGSEIYGENVCFESSHRSLGIQLVDILTTSIRRAMNGRLGIDGWGEIGRLMVGPLRRKQVIHLVDLSGDGMTAYVGEKYPPFYQVLRVVDQTCKPMFI